ncbi:MAG: class I adenylate-forming enzyme family protein [Pseudomonadota bacterium]
MLTPAEVHAKKREITAEGGLFERQQVTLDGHDYRAYRHAPNTLIEVFDGARQHGDLEFLVYQHTRLSYRAFFEAADALAATLQRDYGLTKGDRFAIAMRNNPSWVIAYTAATLIGAVVVPVNSWGKTEELSYALSDSGSHILVCDEQRFSLIEDQVTELEVEVLLVAESSEVGADGERVRAFADAVDAGRDRTFVPPTLVPEDPCVILYTSGSTGFPKGVLHRQIALCQSLMNMFFLGYLVMELEGAREFRGGAERETPLLTVPLFHATGLLSGFILPLHTAQKVVMMYKWDAGEALRLIESEKVTSLSSVPTIVQDLLTYPGFDTADTTSLIRVTGAGAATPAGLPELIEQKCGAPSRSAGWGMTETLAVGGTMSGAIFDLKPNSAGIVSPLVDMRFRDSVGALVEAEQGGELEVRSVTCTPGYWEKPEANAATFDGDRWMKTGDMARIDEDGFLHITGRIKEIVIRGGENIYPGEIEHAVYALPAVKENVVFGIPDATMGEELALVVYLNPGADISEGEIRDHLGERLAGYKVPRFIDIWQHPLPQNASGKLHKLKVRDAFLEAR